MRMRIMRCMFPIEHIRKKVFGLSQGQFAALAKTTQPTVCRWERGELAPNARHLALIRASAQERGIALDDSWFFEAPAGANT